MLRELSQVEAGDDVSVIRAKLIRTLLDAAASLPEDLRLAAVSALAIHHQSQHAFLQERLEWLARTYQCNVRTARRRVDDALQLLAASAASRQLPPSRGAESYDDWYVEQFDAVLRMDGESPEAIERRRIVASVDGVDRIDVQIGVPRASSDVSDSRDLLVEVLYGGTLKRTERRSESVFRFVFELPFALQLGERHEYSIIFRVPPRQPMRSHYVFASPRRCDAFSLRVRFGRDNMPRKIWLVDGALPRVFDEAEPAVDDLLTLDRAGELHVNFVNLKPGLGYGVQWQERESDRSAQ
jgi:hypothetical protein